MPAVSVIIPTYNALGQVEPLLNQLAALRRGGAPPPSAQPKSNTEESAPSGGRLGGPPTTIEVIVADDASPDGTADRLADLYPQFTIVKGETNVGFGANVMRGVKAATGDYLFLLNSDVELCGDPLTPLIDLLESEQSTFAAMPLIYNTHLGMIENLARLYCHRGLCWHTELEQQEQWTSLVRKNVEATSRSPAGWDPLANTGDLPVAPTAPIDAVLCGAAFACRRERFLQLGGLDQRYRPFYWEDVALGFAAARRAWRCVTVPQALVVHRHSESIAAKVGERKLRYLLLNQLRFVRQYRGDLRPQGLKHERLWWLARSARALTRGDLQFAWEYLKAAALP